jgi:hypothetical protein
MVDIVKFDLEGFEFDALRSMLGDQAAMRLIKYLMFEVCSLVLC